MPHIFLMGLREARLLASCEAYKQVGELYGKNYKHCRLERPGKTRLFIISPKHRKLAKDLEGRYEGGGIITKINNEIWELQFNDYINKVDWEFEWKSILWTNIYQAFPC